MWRAALASRCEGALECSLTYVRLMCSFRELVNEWKYKFIPAQWLVRGCFHTELFNSAAAPRWMLGLHRRWWISFSKRKVTWLKNKKTKQGWEPCFLSGVIGCDFLISICARNRKLWEKLILRRGWFVTFLFVEETGLLGCEPPLLGNDIHHAVWRPEPLPHWTAFKQSEKQQQQGVRVARPTYAQAVLFCLHRGFV